LWRRYARRSKQKGGNLKIIEVSYGKTFNAGNYESIRVDMKASVDEGEDVHVVTALLITEVAKLNPKGGK
jgi:hypothetical protein